MIAILAYIPKEVWYLAIAIVVVVIGVKLLGGKRNTASNTQLNLDGQNSSNWGTSSAKDTANRPRAPFRQDRFTADVAIRRPPLGEVAYKVRWVPASKNIQVAGFDIAGGMVYAGLSLKAWSGSQDPALINPSLKVFSSPVDIAERRMPYWPSYSEVTPEARRAYLQWLASGRENPSADVGYVFLFFYGLERRVLIDFESEPANPEIKTIEQEVRRLLHIYENSGSFRNYATNFLGYLSAGTAGAAPVESVDPPNEPRSYELPLTYRIGLARFAATRKPLPAQWAMKWALIDPTINCRTPIQRCPAEFTRLFSQYYAEEFGDGMVLPVNKTKLRVSYRPASGGFAGHVFTRDVGDLPDIGAISAPQKKLQKIVDCCAESLDRYSRYLGRHPSNGGSLDGLALLPIKAWPGSSQQAVRALKDETSTKEVIVTWKELLSRFADYQTIGRTTAIQVATELEKIGIGIEPDLVTGCRLPDEGDKIVLFSTAARDKRELSNADYRVASLTVELGAMAATADGHACEAEVQQLEQVVNRWTSLQEAARQRLRARIHLQTAHPPSISSVRKKVELLSGDSRRAIADILVHVVRADGVVSPSEVKFLESAYKVLQLDAKLVYGDLHNGKGSVCPIQTPGSTGTSVGLDPERIAQLHKETEHISAVLKDVFAEEVTAVEPAVEAHSAEREGESSILGLTPEYSMFTRLLLSRPQWARAELADVAADMELMLDGALERINEAAIEKFDEPLTDGDDPVDVNRAVLDKVFA